VGATAPEQHELHFRVMGTDAHLVVCGGPAGLCEQAARSLDRLEARWSRFRDDSEISRLNAAAGRPVVVSRVTFELIERAARAWDLSKGAYDPTVLPSLVAAGYDRDFSQLAEAAEAATTDDPDGPGMAPAPPPIPRGAGVITLDRIVGSVVVPPGVALDVGGIAKGVAADLVAGEVLDAGALGVCVNVGGDLRVSGAPPSGRGWAIEIEREPGPASKRPAPGLLVVAEGGIATTSRRRRVWRRGGEVRHHIIDPRTGRPAQARWSSVTVVAGTAGDAEPAATAAFLADDSDTAARALAAFGAVGLAFDAHGLVHELGEIGPFLASPA
jgi:thiamine biosynthesis lipoprotein